MMVKVMTASEISLPHESGSKCCLAVIFFLKNDYLFMLHCLWLIYNTCALFKNNNKICNVVTSRSGEVHEDYYLYSRI